MQERIRAENLRKRYGNVTALDGVSITALKEEACGVFGPSGSGKSTLLRMLAGIETPDSGTVVRSEGKPAVSFAEPALDESLTPLEILNLHAVLYEIPRHKRRGAVRETLLLFDLDSARDTRVSALSSGLRKQVELARVLISPSAILLLDEPMCGLDSLVRERVWNHLLMLKSIEHRTIVIATSRPDDAELCDRITILNRGRALADGTVSKLRSMVGPEAVVIKPLGPRRPGGRGAWAEKRAITMAEQDGALVVEMSADSRPAELVREISGQAAAVRLRPKGLDVVIEELIVQSDSGRREMMSAAEKVWALTIREMWLVARSRARLLCTLAVPLAGGIICGWMTRTTALPPVYCLAVFMTLGSLVLAADHSTRASHAVSAIAGRIVFDAAWILAACLVLIAQAAILTTSAAVIGGFQVSTGILTGTIGVSLAVSAIIHRFLPGDWKSRPRRHEVGLRRLGGR